MDRDPGASTPPLEIDLRVSSRTAAIRTIIRAFLDNTIPTSAGFWTNSRSEPASNWMPKNWGVASS